VRRGETGTLACFCEFLNTSGVGTLKSILDTEECRRSGWIDHERASFFSGN